MTHIFGAGEKKVIEPAGKIFYKFRNRFTRELKGGSKSAMGESTKLYEFGPFCLNSTDHSLLREGQPVELHPKAFKLLELFLEKSFKNPGKLFTKDYLLAQIWGDKEVGESNLVMNIAELRKALGDHPDNPQFIKTVPKEGYRFIAKVHVVMGTTGFAPKSGSLGIGGSEPVALKSLANFPQDFLPLTIICGDRRYGSPSTRGDIFVASASTTDLMFLLRLGLPQDCLLTTDKSFARMTDDEREKKFSRTNVMVIGSPKVNLASRFFNQHGLFRFAIDRKLMEMGDKLQKLSLIDCTGTLRVFWEMAMNLERKLSEYKDYDISQPDLDSLFNAARQIFGWKKPTTYIERFANENLIDFTNISGVVRLERMFHNDFAILSLGRNPFAASDEYVCIMAAGKGGAGTAHAVRLLSEAERLFATHPFGGILKVSLNLLQNEHPPRIFEKATARWYTKDYTPKTVGQNLEAWLQHGIASQLPTHSTDDELFDYLTVKEIEECLRFVQAISKSPCVDTEQIHGAEAVE